MPRTVVAIPPRHAMTYVTKRALAIGRIIRRRHAAASPACERRPIPGHLVAADEVDFMCFGCGWRDVVTGQDVCAETAAS